jgi:hypothetical protein
MCYLCEELHLEEILILENEDTNEKLQQDDTPGKKPEKN